jgi:hypothetical protein
MHKSIIIAGLILAAALIAGCGGETAPESAPLTSAKPKATSAPTKPTSTTLTERQAHWQDVVQSMGCPELAELEQKRMVVQFNDQAESLAAIHDRQAELHC